MAGIGLVAAIGLVIALTAWTQPFGVNGGDSWGNMDARWTAWRALLGIPPSTWATFRSLMAATGVSLLVLSAVGFYFALTGRRRLACVSIAAAMILPGHDMIEGVSRVAPYFSLADAARFLNPKLAADGQLMFEGPLDEGSSLSFYLERKFSFVGQNAQKEAPFGSPNMEMFLKEKDVLERWGAPEEAFLIVDQQRAPYWQRLLTDRFHIFHQLTMCGTYAVLSNQL
jgi:hypothetical protein